MKNELQSITPKQAAEWLATANTSNRPLRPTHVATLAKEMTGGKWEETHQGIAFCKDGRLLDGQHRLAAIAQSGKTIRMYVATGLSEEAYKGMDCGLKRANYDRIHLVNDTAKNKLICTAVRCFLYEKTGSNSIRISQIEDEFLEHDKAWEWVANEFSGGSGVMIKGCVMASFAIYYFVNPARARVFAEGYRDGAGLEVGSPVLKLRNHVLQRDKDLDYWRIQYLMRSHLHGKGVASTIAASEDMLGNKNSIRIIAKRSKASKQAGKTRIRLSAG